MTDKFIRAMFGTAEVLGREISKERVKGYWSVLGHFGDDVIVQALKVSVVRSGYFPTPSDLISIINGEDKDPEAEAMAAWSELQNCLRSSEAQSMIDSDLRVKSGVIAAGGLYDLRMGWSGEAVHWKARKFIKAFIGTSARRRKELAGREVKRISEIIEDLKPEGEDDAK